MLLQQIMLQHIMLPNLKYISLFFIDLFKFNKSVSWPPRGILHAEGPSLARVADARYPRGQFVDALWPSALQFINRPSARQQLH